MSVTNAALTASAASTPESTLREVIEQLAPIERLAGSDGEREAAEWIAQRLTAAGATARVDEEVYLDGYAALMTKLAALGAASGLAGLLPGGRLLGIAGGAASAALIADDISNGIRPARRLLEGEKTTWNVVAEAGDLEAERTIVILAHHDAAKTGKVFESTLQEKLVDAMPGIVERIDTSLPQWWGVIGSPALVAFGAATRRRRLMVLGALLSAAAAAAMNDIATSPVVPAPTTT